MQFKPPLYKERWKHIVKTIEKRSTTLMDIHTEVFGKDVRYVDESDDPDVMGECPTDSEDEGEAES